MAAAPPRPPIGGWLVYHKKIAGISTLRWSEVIDEALCFDWIDSQAKPMDEHTYRQYFSPRKATSGWSKVNKEKNSAPVGGGTDDPAGLARVAAAQQNGSWTLLDEVEMLHLPANLAQAFAHQPAAQAAFLHLGRTARRALLLGLVLAKRPATPPAAPGGHPNRLCPTT
ncbi:hypothetical protein DNI29_21505 [Hymenobacter sediminis]|uniref:YdeI/OmpD-associated family protein n=1 Tax=Hymenobacter sediminis TaxID=2218621 RepID=UPI000DA66024|nr:YdeI/OmpD-associated family protein [Hymenobacter sediminis]RPD44290.1 hypothetical protein DNI29_21505 [Hymenobacter sediminis]